MSVAVQSRSDRIKRGIRRARLAGKVIGANGRRLAAENRAEAISRASELFPLVVEFRSSGLSYRQMVARLNARAEPTPGGVGRWHVRTLQRLMARAPEVETQLAHDIIARSDAARPEIGIERMEAAFAAAHQLREAQRTLRARTAHLVETSRSLCAELEQIRTRTEQQLAASVRRQP